MLDLRQIRTDPEPARAGLRRRGVDPAVLDEALELDERRRTILPELEELRRHKNEASKRIGELQRAGEDASEAIDSVRVDSVREKELNEELRSVEERRAAALAALPNLPEESAPPADTTLREVGEAGRAGKNHVELLGDLIDSEAGARVAGSRFVYLKGPLVRLELALVTWVLDLLEGEGFTPVVPPVLVREEALFGTGMLPDTEQQIYRVPEDDLYLVGTSEVSLASLHAGQILDELPLRYAGFSPCFRREAGAAGKDTQGLFRVHQFDKVEMFAFVDPDSSRDEHERLLGDRGADPADARHPVSGGQHRGRRPRRLGREEVRPRGVAARSGALPRADLVLEYDRLPGPSARCAPPSRAGRAAPRAHVERDRRGGRPYDHRLGRERPARGRQHRASCGPSGLRRAQRARTCCLTTVVALP